MIYLSGCLPSKPHLQQLLRDNNCGILVTPFSQKSLSDPDWIWAADNGCFSSKWEYKTWATWIQKKPNPDTALFAVVPDTVSDPIETLEKWETHHQFVRHLGFKPAFVLQDGATNQTIPWEQLDCLFIGGSTEYKLSDHAKRFVHKAKQLGKWVHMGRVNSQKRIELAFNWGCDSADGTYIAFGPDINTPKLVQMLQYGTRPQLQI